MFKMALLCGIAVLFAGCDTAGDSFGAEKYAVSGMMKDPESAQFSELRRVGDAVCGKVNAKNSFGGYVGYKKFAIVENNGHITAAYLERAPDSSKLFDSESISNNANIAAKCG